MHADRTNRVVLTLVGLISLLIGAGAMLAGYGVFGNRFKRHRLLDNQLAQYFRDHGDWLWPAVAGAAFIVMLLSLLWLLRLLFSTDRTSEIALDPVSAPDARSAAGDLAVSGSGFAPPRLRHRTGRTTVAAPALAQVVAGEIAGYHGVSSARARVLGDPQHPLLVIEITASRRADFAGLVSRVQDEAVRHAQEALAPAHLRVKLDLAVNDKATPRAV